MTLSMYKNQEKLVVQTQTGSVFINLKEIVYCKGEGNYTEINLVAGKRILISCLLCDIERKMAQSSLFFFRIHKSFLINVNYIVEYRNCREKRIILPGSIEIPIAHRKAKEFCALMKIHFMHIP
jgi:two-component system, LytTR family, response regulator